MASQTTSDVLLDTLIDWGVEVIFGLPGDGINGVFEAIRVRQDKIRFIQVRHEEAAAFAACAYSKYTGKLGVCVATSGPGGIHLLNGLYDAKLDGQSVLAITGMQHHDLITTHTQQDVELDRTFMDVACYNARVMGPEHIHNVASMACRTALTKRGVAHITIPVDVQSAEVSTADFGSRNVPGHNADVFAKGAALPREDDLQQAADVINDGKKVVLFAGRGALGCGDILEEVAEKTGAVICKALLGKAVVPDDSPYTTGQSGLLGTEPTQDALEDCDTLVMVGTSFPYIEYLPKPGSARGVQIDLDPGRIGLRYPVEIGLVGDAGNILKALLPRLRRKDDRPFLEKAQKNVAKWKALMEERGTRQDVPMKPQVVAWELGKRLRNDAIVSCDSGTIATWWARQIPVKKGQMHSLSGNLATMAPGLPYSIAAQVAYPDRQVVAFVGDGGLSMLMADFVTCVKYNLPVKVVVINNHSLGQIKWEQMVFLGNPEFACDLAPIDFAKVAEAMGGRGWHVEDPKEVGRALDEALAHPGPAIIDCFVDTHEPPMPPKTKVSDAKQMAKALARGTPARGKIARTIAGDVVREII